MQVQGLQPQRQAAGGRAGEQGELLQVEQSRQVEQSPEEQWGAVEEQEQRPVLLMLQVVELWLEQHIPLSLGDQELVPRSLGQSEERMEVRRI